MAIFLVGCNVLIWPDVLTDDGPVPVVPGPVVLPSAVVSPVRETVGAPVRLVIPSIAMDAAVERVALAADGSMGVPQDPLNVGWFEPGPQPGEAGNAVVSGHVDWWNGATAVFADLDRVVAGDGIDVRDDRGKDTRFTVREIRRYDANADATDIFVSGDGKAHLVLITCDGEWDRRIGQYSKRLVVFADEVI